MTTVNMKSKRKWLNLLQASSVEQVIAQNQKRLRAEYVHFAPGEPYGEWFKEVDEKIRSGEVDDELIGHWWATFLLGRDEDASGVPFVHATVFTALAINAYKNGDVAKSWPLISHACYLCGIAESISFRKGSDLLDRQAIARKGGHGKAAKSGHGALKAEILNAIRNPPAGGWGGRTPTADAVAEAITAAHAGEPAYVLHPDLVGAVYRWLALDATISATYIANRAPTK